MEKITITKKIVEWFEIEQAIRDLVGAPGLRLQILVSKNLHVIEKELELIKEKSKFSDEFTEVLKKTDEIKKEFATKDDSGAPKLTEDNKGYQITDENLELLKTALNEFWEVKENKKLLDKQNKLLAEYDTYIKGDDLTIDVWKMPSDYFIEEYFNKEENIEKATRFAHFCCDFVI